MELLDPARQWPLIGRDSHLATFRRMLADPSKQSLLIYGAAGVGKSRLAQEFLRLAERAGHRTRRATASAAASAFPLGALAHLLPPDIRVDGPLDGFAAAAGSLRGDRLVLLVDDAHLLDVASAALLGRLLDAGLVLLIATVRSTEPAGDAVASLDRGDASHRIDLSTLDDDDVETLLDRVLGAPIDRHARHALASRSGGNALYLRELVLGALQRGQLRRDGDGWQLSGTGALGTARLDALVRARLSTAGAEAQPVLELLSIFDPLSLADAEAQSSPQAVAALEAAGIIRVDHDGRRATVALAHPIYAEVLRAGLPTLRRRALLLQHADRLAGYGLRRREDALAVAVCRLAATGTADPALLCRGAVVARLAHDYRRVVALLEALPDACHTVRSRLLLGEALTQLGEFERAETVLAAIDQHATTESDILAITVARTVNLFWMAGQAERALAVNRSARERLADCFARDLLDIEHTGMLVASNQLDKGMARLDLPDGAPANGQEAVVWLRAARMKATALALIGQTGEAVRLARRMLTVHSALGEIPFLPHETMHLNTLSFTLTEAGQLAEASDVIDRALAQLLTVHAPFPHAWLCLHQARVHWLAGRPATARRWYAEAATVSRRHHNVTTLHAALSGLAASAAVLGDLDAARSALAERDGRPHSDVFGDIPIGWGWVHAAEGRGVQARASLLAEAERARDFGYLGIEAQLLTDVARLGGAAQVAPRLAELAARSDGPFSTVRAEFAAALTADDGERLLHAATALEVIGAHLMAAEAAVAATHAWRRAGNTRRAGEAAHRAASIKPRCEGARTPSLWGAQLPAALTDREREIAKLAASGRTSREIADLLVVSPRTVDNHLNKVYIKLGVGGRGDLAKLS